MLPLMGWFLRGLPELAHVVGLRKVDGTPRLPACKIDTRAVAGPSNVEKY